MKKSLIRHHDNKRIGSELVIVVGCPLAGKTLHAQHMYSKTHTIIDETNTIQNTKQNSHQHTAGSVVHPPDIAHKSKQNPTRKTTARTKTNLENEFFRAIQRGDRRIVVDSCNASRTDRSVFAHVGRELGYRVVICFIDRSLTDVELLIRAVSNRNQQRSYLMRLNYFRDHFQFPSLEEPVDHIVRVDMT